MKATQHLLIVRNFNHSLFIALSDAVCLPQNPATWNAKAAFPVLFRLILKPGILKLFNLNHHPGGLRKLFATFEVPAPVP